MFLVNNTSTVWKKTLLRIRYNYPTPEYVLSLIGSSIYGTGKAFKVLNFKAKWNFAGYFLTTFPRSKPKPRF